MWFSAISAQFSGWVQGTGLPLAMMAGIAGRLPDSSVVCGYDIPIGFMYRHCLLRSGELVLPSKEGGGGVRVPVDDA
jgi:hypothetical protein